MIRAHPVAEYASNQKQKLRLPRIHLSSYSSHILYFIKKTVKFHK